MRLALPPIALAIVSVAVAHAEKAATTVVAKQDLQAKVAYCETCHGASGRGFRGYYPIPRLAGQQPEYFENQLRAFTERRRTNNIMFNVAHRRTCLMPITAINWYPPNDAGQMIRWGTTGR